MKIPLTWEKNRDQEQMMLEMLQGNSGANQAHETG